MQTLRLSPYPAIIIALALSACCATPARDRAVRSQFMATNPCPATQSSKGPCPGYEADHIVPLCAGGKDELANLQWLTVEAHKAKTRLDIKTCRK